MIAICQSSLSRKRSTDENEIAFQLVSRSTQEPEPDSPTIGRSPIYDYMAQIGSKGGRIGGKRRIKTMTAEQRRKIAKKAAKSRWAKLNKNKSFIFH
jgi:hypothetical protein